MKNWTTCELIASAVATTVGLVFLYDAISGEQKNDFIHVAWYMGIVFSAFSLSVAPQRSFKPIKRDGLNLETEPVYGWAAILGQVGTASTLLAAASWIVLKLFS